MLGKFSYDRKLLSHYFGHERCNTITERRQKRIIVKIPHQKPQNCRSFLEFYDSVHGLDFCYLGWCLAITNIAFELLDDLSKSLIRECHYFGGLEQDIDLSNNLDQEVVVRQLNT